MAEGVRSRDSFDSHWKFRLGDVEGGEAVDLDDAEWRTVDLPHDWSVEQPFDPDAASGTGYLPGGVGWYRKAFDAPESWLGREVELHFDGVYRNSEVWVNGEPVGGRPYGYIPFSVRLTPHLKHGDRNVVAVRVEHEAVADSRWYTGSGIYRHVWLDVTGPISVARWGTFVTTPRVTDERSDVTVANTIRNLTSETAAVRVETTVVTPGGQELSRQSSEIQIAAQSTETAANWHVIKSPSRWSLQSPSLYSVVTRVYLGDQLFDETSTDFGVRSFRFDPDEGFFLNGEPTLIKGLCLHHDAGVVGAAVPDDVLYRRLKIVKDFGANAVRCSHNPMAAELYAMCDRLGLLVMDEAFDEWELGKRKWVKGRNVGRAKRAGYNEDFEEWGERDAADMVRRSRNHPSIILWSIGNEIDYPGDPYDHPEFFDPAAPPVDEGSPSATRLAVVAPKLIAAVKREDPTRPVTMALSNTPAANNVGLAAMLDVCGYNYQEQFYDRDHAEFPGRVIYGSETGQGPRSWRAVVGKPFISGQFLWSGFDFLGEAGRWPNHGSRSGVFDTRGFVKPYHWWRRAEWNEEPFVRLLVTESEEESGGGRRWQRLARYPRLWQGEAGSDRRVLLVTNCEEVRLRLNDADIATRVSRGGAERVAQLAYEPGKLAVTGLNGGREVAHDAIRTPGPASTFTLAADRPGLSTSRTGTAAIEVRVVDADGTLVPDWRGPISVEVTGAGRLLGVDNGDQDDPTPLQSPTKRAVDGRLLVHVKSAEESGSIRVRASGPGLAPADLTITVR
ncbi:Beta-galactosidase [Posidoniimonas polymericola]|uniref:Beta-galactosidase n=2 Tax=Posidoniimonas polymericola TaxID=2528002 RepID=A0A5C5ZF36_9BACT|nr:Beta-galactosidase [Posidoniimonas polymericola]